MERLSVVKLFLVSLWGIVFTSCSGVTSRERPNERGRLILDPEESKLASTDADLTRGMILFGQERLARFCYGVRFSGTMDQQTVRAVREYQKRSGLPVSGNLDPETRGRMASDDKAIQLPKSSAQPFQLFSIDERSLMAKGIWIPRGGDPKTIEVAYNAYIVCYHLAEPGFPHGFCDDISVGVNPYTGFLPSSQSFLKLRVVRWGVTLVEANGEDPLGNVSYLYRFDLKQSKATREVVKKEANGPSRPIESDDLEDPWKTLWKWKLDAALEARRRVIVMEATPPR